MRKQSILWIGAILVAVTLGLLAGVAARGETNDVEKPATRKPLFGITINAGDDEVTNVEGAVAAALEGEPSSSGKWHGMPKEILEKLSAEQILEIEKARLAVPDVPSAAPLIVAIVFLCPVAIVAVVLVFRQRRHAMLHKTLTTMIEKGTPIPPELLRPEMKQPKSDLRRGVVLIAVGLGIAGFLLAQKENAWGVGLIPLLIGVGYLVVWKLDPNRKAS